MINVELSSCHNSLVFFYSKGVNKITINIDFCNLLRFSCKRHR